MKTNYLNNKDILKAIHKSKLSYCSFADPRYTEYDIIIAGIEKINKKNLTEAKKLRAEKLTKKAIEDIKALGAKPNKIADDLPKPVKPKDIAESDIVFRVMTWDHIPIDMEKTNKARRNAGVMQDDEEDLTLTEYDLEEDKTNTKYVRVNFPPFQHWKYNEEGELVCVGKSHWIGDLETGSFSKDHGKITNELAMMFMKLCERYGTRANWRNYTYNDEMRSQALLQLTQIGLQFDESKSQNPFAYYTAAVTNSFTRVFNIEKRNQVLRDDIMEQNGLTPSFTRQLENSMQHRNSDGD
jgi:hypothetical protein